MINMGLQMDNKSLNASTDIEVTKEDLELSEDLDEDVCIL